MKTDFVNLCFSYRWHNLIIICPILWHVFCLWAKSFQMYQLVTLQKAFKYELKVFQPYKHKESKTHFKVWRHTNLLGWSKWTTVLLGTEESGISSLSFLGKEPVDFSLGIEESGPPSVSRWASLFLSWSELFTTGLRLLSSESLWEGWTESPTAGVVKCSVLRMSISLKKENSRRAISVLKALTTIFTPRKGVNINRTY